MICNRFISFIDAVNASKFIIIWKAVCISIFYKDRSVLYGFADSKLFLGISSFIFLLLSFCKRPSMEADIRSLARRPGGYEEVDRTRELVTRDLLGNGEQVVGTAEVDLELRVPDGWERRLDLVVRNQPSYSCHSRFKLFDFVNCFFETILNEKK